MDIRHDEDNHRFDLYGEDGTHMGEICYRVDGLNDIYATHTQVFPPYEGRGLAAQLLDALVAYAGENGQKIVPICPYVVAAFKKFPDKYAKVIK